MGAARARSPTRPRQALERALASSSASTSSPLRLQRSLLPDRAPERPRESSSPATITPAAPAVEVGGDWYDAVRRPDGIVQLCVGDVSGRGIGAATVMGRQRNTFHAYAYECASPAEIIRRMLRHVDSDEMITVACVSLDPYTGELAYACAGPSAAAAARSRRRRGGPARRGERAADRRRRAARHRRGAGCSSPGHATLALYTDGLIERRGANIDDGIDLLGARCSPPAPSRPRTACSSGISEAIGAPVDDVALLVVDDRRRRVAVRARGPGRARRRCPGSAGACAPGSSAQRVDADGAAEIVLAVSEACNNAIEHAYRGAGGALG